MSDQESPAVHNLNTELAPMLQHRDTARRRGKMAATVALFALGLVVAVAGTLMLVLLVQARDTSVAVESCIVPGGGCYERSQQRLVETQDTHRDVLRVLDLLCREYPTAPECQ